MESTIFLQLAAVLAVAAGISIIMRLLRQPLIIGYILSGIICGPSLFDLIHNHEAFESFSQIGIALLLFIVGLGLNVAVIRSTGKPVFLVFFLNVFFVGTAGYGVGHFLGMEPLESALVGLALVFSSTIVVVKSLIDKREQHRLYGQIAIGVLLVEDIAATVMLVFIAAANTGGGAEALYGLLGKGLLLGGVLTFTGWFILSRLVKFFASNQEFLFTFALAWAFSVAAVFEMSGFSMEVGALFAGVSLASLPYAQEISTRLKPLRDFFLLLFFISLGGTLTLGNLSDAILPALLFSVIAIVVKPFSVSTSLGLLGYTKQTGFKVGSHLSQTSEFSIIMLTLAAADGFASERAVGILTITTFITIGISTYLMQYDDELYRIFARFLSVFEKRNVLHEKDKTPDYKLFLFGYHKGGHEFVNTFRDMRKRYVVVDYDPEVIETLERQHINHVYGDATDYELLGELGVGKGEMVASILPGHTTNRELLKFYLKHNPDGIFICHATNYDNAADLYEHGASYVMLPHFIGSEKMSAFIRKNGSEKAAFDTYRKKHIITLGQAAIT
ncbi:cation:proton antiporter [Candidatus Saccharibacteria bacterium]|nr:MAG: cation:proton antiporter [Candidatus Saccharibacteria bacterium]